MIKHLVFGPEHEMTAKIVKYFDGIQAKGCVGDRSEASAEISVNTNKR